MSVSNNFPTIRPSLSLDFANTKTLDPRITFTRSTTATCYDGVTTAKAEENLLTYSQEFDNAAWARVNATVTANATTAPDGTLTADTFTCAASSGNHEVYQNNTLVSGSQYVMSVFAKKNTHDFIQLRHYSAVGGATRYANFNLATGALGTVGADATASITDFGNGWYRCVMIATPTGTAGGMDLWIIPASTSSSATSFTAAGTESVYLWGAQVEQRSSVTAYTPTTTQPITNYIPVLQTAAANVARFDHDPVTGESLGLLIEEQRTNLLTYSAGFSNGVWTKTNITVTANTVVAPDGTLTGFKVVEDTSNNPHALSCVSVSLTAGTTYSMFFYVKGDSQNQWVQVTGTSSTFGSDAWANFDLINGVVGNKGAAATASIQAVGNGWYKCVVSAPATVSNNGGGVVYLLNNADTNQRNPAFLGDGYSGVFLWGAQVEAGSFPTSYIPTTSAAVTRTADAASMTGENFSSWYRADEGTLYVNGSSISPVSSVYAALNNPSGSARITAFVRKIGNNGTSGIIANSAGTALLEGASYSGTADDKAIIAYGTNSFATTGNAGSITQTTSGYVSAVTQMEIGRQTHLGSVASGTIKKISYYPQRLSNTQLQALTA